MPPGGAAAVTSPASSTTCPPPTGARVSPESSETENHIRRWAPKVITCPSGSLPSCIRQNRERVRERGILYILLLMVFVIHHLTVGHHKSNRNSSLANVFSHGLTPLFLIKKQIKSRLNIISLQRCKSQLPSRLNGVHKSFIVHFTPFCI